MKVTYRDALNSIDFALRVVAEVTPTLDTIFDQSKAKQSIQDLLSAKHNLIVAAEGRDYTQPYKESDVRRSGEDVLSPTTNVARARTHHDGVPLTLRGATSRGA